MQFTLNKSLLFVKILVGFLFKYIRKYFFIIFEIACRMFEFKDYNGLNGICTDIVPCLAISTGIFGIVTAAEIVSVFVDYVGMITHIVSAISAAKQSAECELTAELPTLFQYTSLV